MADDCDSEMLSSTSSSPSAKSIPLTPAGNRIRDTMSVAAMVELSPPGSQGPATREVTMTGYNEAPKESMTSTGFLHDPEVNDGMPEGSASQMPSVLRDEPGAAWMNKKSEEDAKRVLEYVVDKEFSLSMSYPRGSDSNIIIIQRFADLFVAFTDEFGDPFDDRDINPTKTKA
ncbi:hypothetical protein FQN49_002489 [Arthroderma sp. PD_2]|nr:hypothetical protein FQN49_002489 [Arthroderma sp. PD_2]